MKIYRFIIIISLLLICISGYAQYISESKFTYKALETCSNKYNYSGDTIGYYIGIKTPEIPNESETFTPMYEKCSYYWNKIFDCYSNEDKIKILEELLDYSKDSDLSGKKVKWYGKGKEGQKPNTISYTLQTEALYIITLLTMSNYAPYYCPYPVLLNGKTGKEVGNNQKELKEVYKIYRKWIAKYKKTGFKNFRPPLEKSHYSWFNSDERLKDITFEEITLSGTIIGK